MKRLVSLLLVVVLFAFGVMPVSASAGGLSSGDAPDGFIDLLSYGFPVGQDSHRVPLVGGAGSLTYKFPKALWLHTVDLVVYSGSGFTARLGGSFNQALSVKSIRNGLYRVYGNVPLNYFKDEVTVEFTSYSESNKFITISSFLISSHSTNFFPENGTIQYIFGDKTASQIQPSPTQSAVLTIPGSASFANTTVFVNLMQKWVNYDLITFDIAINCPSISSIQPSAGNRPLPYFISQVYPDDSVYAEMSVFHVVIDVRSLDRTQPYVPCVRIECHAGGGSSFFLLHSDGIVLDSVPAPEISMLQELTSRLALWFDNLQFAVVSGFDRLISVISPDKKPGEDFGSTVESQAGQLGEAGDILNSVTRPPVQDFDVQIDSFVNPADVTFLGGVVRPFMENKIVLTLLLMSLTLATLGYVLYGKR